MDRYLQEYKILFVSTTIDSKDRLVPYVPHPTCPERALCIL